MIKNMTELKRRHKAGGGIFFSRSAMQFWNSKIESPLMGGKYFVTSEGSDITRRFTVRQAVANGDRVEITTLSDYQEFETLDEALMFLGDPIGYRAYQERLNAVIQTLQDEEVK